MKNLKRKSGSMIVTTLAAAMLLGSGVSAAETGVLKARPESIEAAQAKTAAELYQKKHIVSTAPSVNPEEGTKETAALILSEEALARIQSAAEEYYTSANRRMISFAQADPEFPYRRPEYEEGYAPGETALFEMSVENNRFQRYAVVGSRDGWNTCSILYEVILKDPSGEKMDTVKEYVSKAYSELSEAEQAQKTAELYQEKYIGFTTPAEAAQAAAEQDADRDFVDTAYENSLARDRHVVELISTHSGIETTAEAWEYNLNYLKLHYEEIMDMEGVNRIFVDLYIETYEAQLLYLEYLSSEKPNRISARTSSYNSADAVAYAEEYYAENHYNPAYPDWSDYGGDCANFISQCLHAGGKDMRGTPGTTEAAENTSNWFSTGSSNNIKNVSVSWRGANAFRHYWTANADACTFSVVGPDSYDFGWKGDAVSLLRSDGTAYHTLIIVGYGDDDEDFILAAHTRDTNNSSLRACPKKGGFIIYHMK